ncbi:MAG: hypothetical protein EG826_16355 [Deltaproteobacteria bacterium]|nr:hypothetical protein [Deltaproteobacteria bacterium]
MAPYHRLHESTGGVFLIDQWNLLKDVKRIEPNALEALVRVPPDCIWFTGHFPGEPILPGIAMIHTVYEAILKLVGQDAESINLSALKRVRFTGPIRPGEAFLLNLTREEEAQAMLFSFKVTHENKVICSGQLTATKRARG